MFCKRQSLALLLVVLSFILGISKVDVLTENNYISLRRLKGSGQAVVRPWLQVGAQRVTPNVGAYTGSITVDEAMSSGASFALVYHSETRKYYEAEAGGVQSGVNRIINTEVKAILSQGITPVICVGEDMGERAEGLTINLVKGQVEAALEGLAAEEAAKVVIAYEPIWAIGGSGSGVAATPEVAQEVHAAIRATIREKFGDDVAKQVRVLYGGSVKPENIQSFLAQPDIDGALIGGASAKVKSFTEMVKIAQEYGPKDGRIPVVMGNWKTYATDEISLFVKTLSELVNPRLAEVGIAPQATRINFMANLVFILE